MKRVLQWVCIWSFMIRVHAYTPEKTPGICDEIQDLDYLLPGEWGVVPNSRLDSVKPVPTPGGNSGHRAVIDAWSGGVYAYDPEHGLDGLVVYGGGHQDYSGNEVYYFDLATLSWQMIIPPSNLSDINQTPSESEDGLNRDGRPCSAHSYDSLEYASSINRFVLLRPAGYYPSDSGDLNRVYAVDLNQQIWEPKAQWNLQGNTYGYSLTGTVDSRQIWYLAAGQDPELSRWDAVTDSWSHFGRINNVWVNFGTMNAAVGKDKFVAVGRDHVLVLDLATNPGNGGYVTTSGDSGDILADSAPGFVFHPGIQKFVAWSGGADVHIFDVDSLSWEKDILSPINQIIPTSASSRGTYGRFRYVPSKNVFIVVNAVDENVYFYKLSSGQNALLQELRTNVLKEIKLQKENSPSDVSTAIKNYFHVNGTSPVTLNLEWDPSPDTVEGYTLFQSSEASSLETTPELALADNQVIKINVSSTTHALTLDPGTYYFRVTAYDDLGQHSEFSDVDIDGGDASTGVQEGALEITLS